MYDGGGVWCLRVGEVWFGWTFAEVGVVGTVRV